MARTALFDRDGYPAEDTLAAIEKWPVKEHEDCADLLRFVAAAWYWPEYAREVAPGRWTFATGGWSGNESLLGALAQNLMFGALMSGRFLRLAGGFAVYCLTEEQTVALRAETDRIVEWAWGRKG